MDRSSNVAEVQRSERDTVPDSVLRLGKYTVKMVSLSWPKVLLLWHRLKRYRSLFSDLTRGDVDNFVRYISSRDTFWLEIWSTTEFVGVVVLENMHKVVDVDAHVLFVDKDMAGKVPVSQEIIKWVFNHFPLQRMTVEIPTWYHTTIRFVRDLGFKQEGKKRQAVLIGGKWSDVYIFGMTRSEAAKCRS